MTTPPYKLVQVVWHDANSPASTDIFDATDLKTAHTTMPVVTVGWLLRDDEQGVTLAGEWFSGTTDFRGLTFVPRALVGEVTEVKVPRLRTRKPTTGAPA